MKRSNTFLIVILILFIGIVIGGSTITFKTMDEQMHDFEEKISQPNDLNPLATESLETGSFFSKVATGIGDLIEGIFGFLLSLVQQLISSFF